MPISWRVPSAVCPGTPGSCRPVWLPVCVSLPSCTTGLCEGERSMKHLEEATLGHCLVFAATVLACNEWKRLVTVGQLGAEQEFL